MGSQRPIFGFVLVLFTALMAQLQAYQFYVGGKQGWVVNPSENYNQWAARMRYQVNDTLFFKYKKGTDSVLVVNKEDYDKCNTQNPIKKMDGGDSTFMFDRSGPFYFISGIKDNCDKGQKLIVVVLAVRNKSPPAKAPPPASKTPAPSPAKIPPPSSSPTPPPEASVTPAMAPGSPSSAPAVSPTPASSTPALTPAPALSPTPASSTPALTPAPALSPTPASSTPALTPAPAVSPTPASSTPALTPAPAYAPSFPTPSVSPAPSTGTTPSPSSTTAPTPIAPSPGGTPSNATTTAPPPSSAAVVSPAVVLMSSVTLVLSLIALP